MSEPCHVLDDDFGPCSLGTKGCDACPECTCHACYGHAVCTCAYDAVVRQRWEDFVTKAKQHLAHDMDAARAALAGGGGPE